MNVELVGYRPVRLTELAATARALLAVDVEPQRRSPDCAQYPGVTVKVSTTLGFHDRFVVLDGNTCVHVEASINRAGTAACFAPLGERGRAALLEGIGDVLQEDQAEDDVLVLGSIHRAAQGVGHRPELSLVTSGGPTVGGSSPAVSLLRRSRSSHTGDLPTRTHTSN